MKNMGYLFLIFMLAASSLSSCTLSKKHETDELISEQSKEYLLNDPNNPTVIEESEYPMINQDTIYTRQNYEYLLKGLNNPTVTEENKYYMIYQDDNYTCLYIVFDENGAVVETAQYGRYPSLALINDRIVSVSVQAGTGIETRWTYYYDIKKDIISRTFYGVHDQTGDNVIYMSSYHTITVRNIFDKTKLYKEFNDFKEITQKSAMPFVDAKFIDNAQKVSITYFNDDYDEITEIFDL